MAWVVSHSGLCVCVSVSLALNNSYYTTHPFSFTHLHIRQCTAEKQLIQSFDISSHLIIQSNFTFTDYMESRTAQSHELYVVIRYIGMYLVRHQGLAVVGGASALFSTLLTISYPRIHPTKPLVTQHSTFQYTGSWLNPFARTPPFLLRSGIFLQPRITPFTTLTELVPSCRDNMLAECKSAVFDHIRLICELYLGGFELFLEFRVLCGSG